MYGVMVENKITVCNNLKEAQRLRDEMIGNNEFSNYVIKYGGGYKIVKIQIEEVNEDNTY